MNRVNPHDLWEVQAASRQLNMTASTLMHKHIRNGSLKLQFSQSVASYGKCLVQDYESGKKTKAAVLNDFKKEAKSLAEQSSQIGLKGIGFVAGVMQTVAGGGICYASAGTLCAIVGAPMMAHGVNNMYENGRFFVDGNPDHVGPVHYGYQKVAEMSGFDKAYGDVAYYGVDLALSGYGLAAKSTTLKAPVNAWNKLPHARRFKLFRYSSEDYLRGYQAMRKPALGIEMGADYSSIKAIRDSYD